MTAAAEHRPKGTELIELRTLSGRELNHLLLEETVEWDQELDWDFSKSAELVRRYADAQSLGGAAIMDRGEVAGYGYTVIEDHKGLIGDLYVRPGWRGGTAEVRLFRVMLDGLIAAQAIGGVPVTRIESQLMLVEERVAKAFQRDRSIRLFERLLLRFDVSTPLPPALTDPMRRYRLEPWGSHRHDEAAHLIATAYEDHVDARINDQYRTFSGAHKFLHNIVTYPGCGDFYPLASFVVLDGETGWMAGLVLTSFVSPEVAHITQLCVAANAQGAGLGYEMLRHAVAAARVGGASRISLTVTTANTAAVDLYRRCGFRELRRFFAYVWEG